MTKTTYKDYIPANARVLIDYNKKEKVKFTYPSQYTYKKAVWKFAYPTIINFWIIINTRLITYLVIIGLFIMLGSVMVSPITSTTESITTTYDWLFIVTNIIYIIMFVICGLTYLLGIPAIITWYLSKNPDRLNKYIPKIGHWTNILDNEIYERKYTSENIKDKKAIITSFKNVYLEYEATGDHSKYLQKISIIEIPYTYIRKRLFRKNTKEKNECEFSAVFHFSKKPITGQLTVQYS